jgi:hypothetical protein
MTVPSPGALGDVRERRLVVTEVQQSTLAPDPLLLRPGGLARQHLVTLSSVEDDAFGEELQVVWEIELGARSSGSRLGGTIAEEWPSRPAVETAPEGLRPRSPPARTRIRVGQGWPSRRGGRPTDAPTVPAHGTAG